MEQADGLYLTHPLHGPATATRIVQIRDGRVVIEGASFSQADFFKVNVLVSPAI